MMRMNDILLIDKPAGITSHDVVDVVRRVTGVRQVGHAGTLDPMATGLLIVAVGKATKTLSKFVGLDKEYEAELTLGATSDTFDREGKIVTIVGAIHELPLRDDIESILSQFRGGCDQRAPIFSAKKIKGKKLYELARAGQATEDMRPMKRVTISALHITHYAYPRLDLTVACSSGTYIRSLADDIGRALGCGAYLSNLRRTKVGGYSVKNAIRLDQM